ncbi:MAG TPA: sigma 54-interacting transcriptional regulator, partial [Candidatus Methylomirabilis sp.]|nr:sigma 54-interacting transcriptional regulator [Candidatus Methylomirabilis sp.]
MCKFRILIVCPEPQGLSLLTSMLKSLGHLIEEAPTDRAAVRFMERNPINLVLASVDPADAEALELLTYVRRKHSEVPVILMFARVHPERAKEALRLGAMAVLKYPVPAAELRAAVLQALEQCEAVPIDTLAQPAEAAGAFEPGLPARPLATPTALAQPPSVELFPNNGTTIPLPNNPQMPAGGEQGGSSLAAIAQRPASRPEAVAHYVELAREIDLVTADPSLKQIIELAGTLAATRSSVLIMGEPGTGKSLLAHLLHLVGGQAGGPFVSLKASDLGEPEREDEELDVPAFRCASAISVWSEKLAQARGGTLHLQEVATLPQEIQFQLLRELQFLDIDVASGHHRAMELTGVRFVLSTSDNLQAAVEQGRFRPELYHRISTVCLIVPPLRHREADVELLAEHFRAGFAQEFRKDVVGFTRDALDALQRHDWPGNVRELKGVIQ